MPLFKKSSLPKFEHRLVTLVCAAIPLVFFSMLGFSLLLAPFEYFFPSQTQIYFVDNHYGLDFTVGFFRLSVVVSLTISSFLLFFKRIFISLFVFVLPFTFLIILVLNLINQVQYMLALHAELGWSNLHEGKGLLAIAISQTAWVEFLLLGFLVLLFLWHVKITVQDRIRQNQLLP